MLGLNVRAMVIGAMVVACAATAVAAGTADKKVSKQVARGQYLVTVAGCFDCHTPGYFLGKPDMARFLGGSDVGFELPGLGVFVGPNLTPDPETGLGKWSKAEVAKTIRTGTRPDGRQLAPIMPWRAFAHLSQADALAIAAFLKTLPPVKNKVAGPFGPSDKPTVFVMKVVPPETAAAK